MKSRYEQLANTEPEGPKWDRYGLSEKQWAELTPEQREIHYDRWRLAHSKCDHPYVHQDIPGYGDILRESYSFDPYFHTAHDSDTHTPEKFFAGTCECNNCRNNVGLERGSQYEYAKRKKSASFRCITVARRG